jgi:hypothetical protein
MPLTGVRSLLGISDFQDLLIRAPADLVATVPVKLEFKAVR